MDLSAHEGEIPIPISSTYVGQSHGHSLIHDATPQLHHHHQQQHHNNFNGPPPPPPPLTTVPTADNNIKKGSSVVVKYRECLKNHAAAIGGNATDGCGEFMPSGEEGSLEALRCSACGCHRNFHRKETEGDNNNTSSCDCSHYHHHHLKGGGGRKLIGGHKGVLISSGPDAAFGYYSNNNSLIPRPTPHSMIMPIGAAAIQTSESDDMEGGGGGYPRPPMTKKRFRTKFSAEQKEKMMAFAERAGWKLQKQEESVVQQFCEEIGVKRRVLKVWMHNNKHNLAKKAAASLLQPSSLNERMDE